MPTTGEPIDEESWRWLFKKVGNKKVPIMNLAGRTEIGGAMPVCFSWDEAKTNYYWDSMSWNESRCV